MTEAKYDQRAERWSEIAYADPARYLAHRGELVLSVGPTLEQGDAVLDLACADGSLADHLPGMRYLGVDASPEMVKAGVRHGRAVVLGDLNDYEPSEAVAATTCFRAMYYADDRLDFFRRVGAYTERKFVFDLNPRRYRLDQVRSDLRAAGFDQLELRPFFSPQHVAIPRPVAAAFHGLERSGPLARVLLRLRFSYLCAAFRGGKNT
jgi:hypothetical protein